jgi:hypothetical protein
VEVILRSRGLLLAKAPAYPLARGGQCESYDALTTARPYKRALSVEETLETMALEVGKGWWDPNVFDHFRKLIAEQPSTFGRAAS